MAGMNRSLKLIEESTRKTWLDLAGRADQGVLGVLFRILDEIAFGTTNKATLVMKDHIAAFLGPIKDWVALTADEIRWGANTKANEALGPKLDRIADLLGFTPPPVVNVSVSLDGAAIAENVSFRIAARARTA